MKSTIIRAAIARIAPTPSNTGPHTAASILPRGLPVLLLSDPPPLFVVIMGVLVAAVVGVLVGEGDTVTVGDGLLVGVSVGVADTLLMVIVVCARNAPVDASEATTVADAIFRFNGR